MSERRSKDDVALSITTCPRAARNVNAQYNTLGERSADHIVWQYLDRPTLERQLLRSGFVGLGLAVETLITVDAAITLLAEYPLKVLASK